MNDIDDLGALSLEEVRALVADRAAAVDRREKACWDLGTRAGYPARADSETVSCLLQALRDPDGELSSAAAYNLGRLHGRSSRRAVRPLIQVMRTAPSEDTRYAAAMALRDLHDPRSISALYEVFEDTTEVPRVRAQAAEALGCVCMWEPSHGGRLAKGLQDREPEVRFWTAYALSQVGDEQTLPALLSIAEDP